MSFSLDIQKFAEKCGKNADQVTRKTVLDIGTRLVERTPVGDADYWKKKPPKGYTGGHARANWSHSTGTWKVQEFDGIDKTGEKSNARIAASIPQKAAGLVHFVGNSVPYIEPLEDGHSRQAPNGMVSVTATEFQSIISRAVGELK